MPFNVFQVCIGGVDATLCEQVEEGIKKQILQQTLLPGERIPPMRTLCTELNCGIVTVNKALMNLKEQKILVSRGNQGMFVAVGSKERIEGLKRERFSAQVKEFIEVAVLKEGIEKSCLLEEIEHVYEEVLRENGL